MRYTLSTFRVLRHFGHCERLIRVQVNYISVVITDSLNSENFHVSHFHFPPLLNVNNCISGQNTIGFARKVELKKPIL